MQNRKTIKAKGPDMSKKKTCGERGKNITFGGGGDIVFGSKHRPLAARHPRHNSTDIR